MRAMPENEKPPALPGDHYFSSAFPTKNIRKNLSENGRKKPAIAAEIIEISGKPVYTENRNQH